MMLCHVIATFRSRRIQKSHPSKAHQGRALVPGQLYEEEEEEAEEEEEEEEERERGTSRTRCCVAYGGGHDSPGYVLLPLVPVFSCFTPT